MGAGSCGMRWGLHSLQRRLTSQAQRERRKHLACPDASLQYFSGNPDLGGIERLVSSCTEVRLEGGESVVERNQPERRVPHVEVSPSTGDQLGAVHATRPALSEMVSSHPMKCYPVTGAP